MTRAKLPKNVRAFVWLVLLSVVLSFLELPFMPPLTTSELRLGLTRTTMSELEGAATLIFVLILAPFFWLAVLRRKNWARWVLFVVFLVSLPIALLNPLTYDRGYLMVTLIEFAAFLVEGFAFYLLFTGDGRTWYTAPDASALAGS